MLNTKNENVQYVKLKELKTILKAQKYPKMVVKKEIVKVLPIPRSNLEVKN